MSLHGRDPFYLFIFYFHFFIYFFLIYFIVYIKTRTPAKLLPPLSQLLFIPELSPFPRFYKHTPLPRVTELFPDPNKCTKVDPTARPLRKRDHLFGSGALEVGEARGRAGCQNRILLNRNVEKSYFNEYLRTIEIYKFRFFS